MDDPAPAQPIETPEPSTQGSDPNAYPNPILQGAGTPPVAGTDGNGLPQPTGTQTQGKTQELTPEEYVKCITPEDGAGYTFDQQTVREFGPAMQELGLTPEQAKAVANRFAKYGAERAQADLRARQERCAAFDKQTMELIKERPHLAEEARAAIDHYFKNRSDLQAIFMGTELSHDPTILTMLADLGRLRMSDGGAGMANGVGQTQAGFAERLSRGFLH